MKLDIESDKVLEAAKQCPQAETVLKTLFPKAFPQVFKSGNVIKFDHYGDITVLVITVWENRKTMISLLNIEANLQQAYCSSMATAETGRITEDEINSYHGKRWSNFRKIADTYEEYCRLYRK